MKRITNKDIRNGFKWCDFCMPEKVPALYKKYGKKACERHKKRLILDEHMTEADHQTWGRL